MLDLDLENNQYSMDILAENIYALDLRVILKTQILDAQFVVNYILNPNYQLSEDEERITVRDVLVNQPHIYLTEIIRLSKEPKTCIRHFDKCN